MAFLIFFKETSISFAYKMSHHEKKSKHHKRSRSRERSSKKKHHRKHSSSPSSSSSESEHDDKFQSVLDKQRQEKKRLKRLEKEKLKEKETPEEKRARRLAKKLRKEEKKKKENNSYLPPQLAYTNLNNPFNDVNLTETFVWEKKLEVEGKSSYSRKKIEKETRARVERNLREMEELKRTRDARLAAREDMEMMQRDADRKAHAEWTSKEAEFQLQQAKVRSKIRIEQNRAKPIDLLSRYIQFGEEDQDEKDADKDEFELEDPLKYLKGLSQDDYEDLVEDIKVYRSLEKDRHSEFWRDVRCVVDDELRKLRDDRGRLGTSIHGSVQQDVDKIFKGKNVDELCQLERTIVNKVNAGGSGTDISYWEGLLMHLKVYIAKTRLKELHQKMLKLKLARIREEQMREVGKFDLEGRTTVKQKRTSSDNEEEDLEKKLRRKIDLDELEAVELDDEQKEMRWKHLTPEQLETATLQLYERGGYSPTYGDLNNAMPGIEILDEDADMKDLLEKRRQHRKVPTGVTKLEAEMLAMAKKGMGGDESTFSVEQPLEAQTHLWSDKYRPRKPTYLNRVQTGFDWNKYNQTHYDMDNPPPKIVQGYKFNIFYPDLLDPSETPSFTVTPCDDPDFAVIKFKAGPPYEDIAFKCVNREWEVSHKHGYKCQFQNGVFQLWFVFKRYRYRR